MSAEVREVLPQAAALIEEGIDRGLHRGVQLYVSREGRPVIDGALGDSHDGVPLTPQTVMLWLSAGKPLTAVAVLRLVESGRVGLHDPVATVIPEFAQNGKDSVTVHHLLTHTGGLESIMSGWPNDAWEEIIARICAAPLQKDWVPGERAAYDPGRSWFVLGEIVRRIDGRPIEDVVRDDLMRPIGMHDSWMSIPLDAHTRYGERIGHMYHASEGGLRATRGHTAFVCAAASPGASCRGPIRELGLFYETLLAGGERSGVRILSVETVDLMTSRNRQELFDETLRHKVDFGLGLIIDSNRHGAETVPCGFGRHCSPRTFGHGGARTSIGFADPEHGLVAAAVANGAQPEHVNNERFRDLNTAIYEDVGLGT